MQQNIDINPELKSKIKVYHAALGTDGKMPFNVRGSSISGNSSTFMIGRDTKEIVNVRSYSLKSFLSMCKLKSIDYLKMDCKGAERYLSVDDLKRVRKGLKIEFTLDSASELSELKSKILSSGFKIKNITQTNKLTDAEKWRWGAIIAYR
jgi:FkbM family methyltransferase